MVRIKTGRGLRHVLLTAVLTALTVLVAVQPVAAGVYLNTIDDEATLNPSGHMVKVTGPIGCDAGEVVKIRVEVTQTSTGATAAGTIHARCTGDEASGTSQNWTVHVATRGPTSFETGEADVEAVAMTRDRGTVTDKHRWSKTVTLVR